MRWSLAAISCSAVVLFACSESQTPTEMVPPDRQMIAAPGGREYPIGTLSSSAECRRAGRRGTADRGQAQGKLHFVYTKAIKGFAAELCPPPCRRSGPTPVSP
jgi:hypothetical protein